MTTTPEIIREASDLGFVPGSWPEYTILANGITFRRTTCRRDRDGDLLYVRYVGVNGQQMLVLND